MSIADQKATITWKKLHGFKNVLAWQRADDLACLIHVATGKFGYADSRLVSQMRGAAVSVANNIAEGYCRGVLGDYIRFCEIARGSLGELGSAIHHCERVGLLKGEELKAIVALYSETSYLLDRLIASLRDKQRKGDWKRGPVAKESQELYEVEPVADNSPQLP